MGVNNGHWVNSPFSFFLDGKPSATTCACPHILSPKLLENWKEPPSSLLPNSPAAGPCPCSPSKSDPLTASRVFHILGPRRKGGAPTGPLKIPRAKEFPPAKGEGNNLDLRRTRERPWSYKKVKSGGCLGRCYFRPLRRWPACCWSTLKLEQSPLLNRQAVRL